MRSRIEEALDARVARLAGPVTLGIALVYLAFAPIEATTRADLGRYIAAVDVLAASALLAAWWAWRRRIVPSRLSQPFMALVLGITMMGLFGTTVMLEILDQDNPATEANLGLIGISAGILLLSWRWYAVSLAMIAVAYVAMFAFGGDLAAERPAAIAVAGAIVAGALAHGVRLRAERSAIETEFRLAEADRARIAALAEARASEAALLEAQRVARIGSFERDLRTGEKRWSATLRELLEEPATGPPRGVEGAIARTRENGRAAFQAGFDALIARGEPLALTAPLVLADGGTRWLRWTARRHDGADGRPLRIIGTAQDVTERVRADEAAVAARREAATAERLASVGALVAGVAHEINNPLHYIGGHLELGQEDVKELAADHRLPEDVRERLAGVAQAQQTAMRGVERIAFITKSLRLATVAQGGARTPHELGPLVESALLLASTRLRADTDVEVDIRTTRRPSLVPGDVSRTLVELITNAGEAAAERERPVVRVGARDDGDSVVIEVSDNGKGMPPDVVSRIFTPLFTTKPHGTGLALAVARRVAEDHGGSLTFETQEGVGTTFRLRLPAGPLVRA